jgi:hypothetical protein
VKAGIDNSFLTLLLNPKARGSVPNAPAKVETLILDLSERGATIVIPTPVLTECLVKYGGTVQEGFEKLKKYSCFEIRPFDERAAIELAIALRGENKADAKAARKNATASKVQFDKQIVSIAKVQEVTVMYSDDDDLCAFAISLGMQARRLVDLPVVAIQQDLPLTYDKTKNNTVATAALPAKVQGSGAGPVEGEAGAAPATAKEEKQE